VLLKYNINNITDAIIPLWIVMVKAA